MEKIKKGPKLLLNFAGLGSISCCPGTIASLVFAILVWAIFYYFSFSWFIFGIGLVFFFLSYFLGIIFIKKYLPKNNYDQKWIVIDEVLGSMIAFLPLIYIHSFSLQNFILLFLWFRFFDILKPLGIKKIDQKKSASSVINDDLLAGLYSALIFLFFYFLL